MTETPDAGFPATPYGGRMEPWWEPALRDVFDGRDVIIAGAVPPAWVEYIDHLTTAGARSIMIVATEGRGIGEAPDVPTVVVEPPKGASMMERLRFGNRTLLDPPTEVRAAVDEFDPRHEAIVVGSFLNEAPELAGRPALSYRRAEWVALEDKTIVDDLWDRAGVDRLPSEVVPVAAAADVAASLDRGAGTVWAADAREGFHGGTHGTRRVVDDASALRATAELGEIADSVRVMPFVDGIACSVHGIVMADGVAVLRPVEMVTLRRGADLVYGGCTSFWDPPAWVRAQMRTAARQVADLLVDEVDYRGTFTVDGVADANGFWPTELNPRFGTGLSVIARAAGNIPILLLHDLAVAGRVVGRPVEEVERLLLDHADAHRAGGTWRQTADGTAEAVGRRVAFDGSEWSWTEDDVGDGTVNAGAGFSRCSYEPGSTPAGPPTGSRAVAFWRFADRELGTGLGDLSPAPDPFT